MSSIGAQGDGWAVMVSSISGNGRRVAFVSEAINLIQGDSNDTIDVFVPIRAG